MRFEDFTRALKKDRPMQIGVTAFVLLFINIFQPWGSLSSNGGVSRKATCDRPPRAVLRQAGQDPLIIRLPITDDQATKASIAYVVNRPVFFCDRKGNWYWMNRPENLGSGQENAEALRKVSDLLCGKTEKELREAGLPEMNEDQRQVFCETIRQETNRFR